MASKATFALFVEKTRNGKDGKYYIFSLRDCHTRRKCGFAM